MGGHFEKKHEKNGGKKEVKGGGDPSDYTEIKETP